MWAFALRASSVLDLCFVAYGSAYASGLSITNENRARKVDGNSNLKLGEPETPVKLRGDQAKSPRDSSCAVAVPSSTVSAWTPWRRAIGMQKQKSRKESLAPP